MIDFISNHFFFLPCLVLFILATAFGCSLDSAREQLSLERLRLGVCRRRIHNLEEMRLKVSMRKKAGERAIPIFDMSVDDIVSSCFSTNGSMCQAIVARSGEVVEIDISTEVSTSEVSQ